MAAFIAALSSGTNSVLTSAPGRTVLGSSSGLPFFPGRFAGGLRLVDLVGVWRLRDDEHRQLYPEHVRLAGHPHRDVFEERGDLDEREREREVSDGARCHRGREDRVDASEDLVLRRAVRDPHRHPRERLDPEVPVPVEPRDAELVPALLRDAHERRAEPGRVCGPPLPVPLLERGRTVVNEDVSIDSLVARAAAQRAEARHALEEGREDLLDAARALALVERVVDGRREPCQVGRLDLAAPAERHRERRLRARRASCA